MDGSFPLLVSRRTIVVSAIFSAFSIAWPVQSQDPGLPAITWNPDIESAWTASQEQGQLLLLFVKTDSCLYCTKMERETYADEAIARHVTEQFVATSMDGRSYPQLMKKLGIRVYPTTVIIGPNAQVLDSISGFVAAGDLQQRLETASKKAATLRR